jgi:hypothetical protein
MTRKHMKNYLTSLAIKEMKIKTTLRFHVTSTSLLLELLSSIAQTTTNVGEDVGEKEFLYTVSGDVN